MEIKQHHPIEGANGRFSYKRMIGIYLLICVLGFAIIIMVFDGLIQRHDRRLTNDICTLVSEKMDTSIKYLSGSVQDISTLISCSHSADLDVAYTALKKTVPYSKYISAGFVTEDGTLFAADSEKQEFEKWGLAAAALSNDGITISEPYRSGMTGQLVFTMFAPLRHDGERTGLLFVTYPLTVLQELANTESLSDETEIWIMDGLSDNIIRCSGADSFLIGSWSNFKLEKPRISNKSGYNGWEYLIRTGAKSGTVAYSVDGTAYTQVFKRIDFMPGWNVVVRIPSRLLSDTIQIFRWALVAFVAVIILATLMLLVFAHNHENAEKKVFENLSNYDPLTGIMNRRYFETSARQLLQGDKDGCTIIFIDVDFFKEINDSYGHETGDKILVGFSELLQEIIGDNGFVGRFGGDEFVVMLKAADEKTLCEIMDRITAAAQQLRIDSAPDYRMHFSAGMACFPEDAAEYGTLMRCADQALYAVKENGRNGWRRFGHQQSA
ncbi:MAG: sensor domain-containing diguanylate cyclase [Oscillospiraceae bacterium]